MQLIAHKGDFLGLSWIAIESTQAAESVPTMTYSMQPKYGIPSHSAKLQKLINLNQTFPVHASQILISFYGKQRGEILFSVVPLIQLSHTSSPCKMFMKGLLHRAHNVCILWWPNDITSGLNCLLVLSDGSVAFSVHDNRKMVLKHDKALLKSLSVWPVMLYCIFICVSPPSSPQNREVLTSTSPCFYQPKMAGSFPNDVISSVISLALPSGISYIIT